MFQQQKIFSFSILLANIFLAFFLYTEPTLSADQCSDNYGGGGFSCNEKANCGDAPENVDTAKEAVAAKKIGKAEGGFITGICDGAQVCCVKKKTAATGAAGSSGAASGSETSDCNPVCQWIKEQYKPPTNPDGTKYQGPLPDCAYSGQCRETNDLVEILINQGRAIFGLIGMVALVAFVYGGFLMVFSFGASDKVQQGKDVMVAAVVGIIIVFSAYLIVSFILKALGVSPEFQAIK